MLLDEVIPCSASMTYRERTEMAMADTRGEFDVDSEPDLNTVEGARTYAEERAVFWKKFNENWTRTHENPNTLERFAQAQMVSSVYASAVYKSICALIARSLIDYAPERNSLNGTLTHFQNLLFIYMGGSVLMVKEPYSAVMTIIGYVKKENVSLALFLEMNFKNKDNKFIKAFVRQAA